MRQRATLTVYTGLVFLLTAVPSLAGNTGAPPQSDTTVLETMIVTDSVRQTTLLDTPGAITVLTTRDIQNSGQTSLVDLISTIPGVINQQTSGKTYFSIRGSRTGMSGGPVIYVDGRPINAGIHNYSKIDTIPLDNVVQIEVVKSPSPAIYGANAARGVILITTGTSQEANTPFSARVSAEYGSWDTARGTAALSGARQQFTYSLTGHFSRTDGYRGSDEDIKNLDGKIGYTFDGGTIDFMAGYNDSLLKYPQGLDETTATNDPRASGRINEDGYLETPNTSDENMANMALNLNYGKNDWKLNASIVYTRDEQIYQKLEDYNDVIEREDNYRDDRNENRFDVRLNGGKTFGNDRGTIFNTLTAGFDYMFSEFDQRRSYPFGDEADFAKTTAKANIDAERTSWAVSANNDLSWNNFRLLTGSRLNFMAYDLENQQPKEVTQDFDGDLDWSVSPSYTVLPGANLFVAYSRAHYYLPLGYYKSDMEHANENALAENLEPEIYKTWEAGFKHQFHKAFNYSVIFYHTTIDDKVVSYYNASNKFKGYRNAGSSTHRGVEFEIDGRPLDWLGYRLSFTTIDAEWDKGAAMAYASEGASGRTLVDLSGYNVNYVPEYEYAAGVNVYLLRGSRYGDLTAALDIHGFGEQYENHTNFYKMPDAHYVDIKLTWDIGRYQLYLTCTNLFDKQWNRYVNSSGKPHSTLDTVYPQDGRYIGIGGAIRF